METKKKRFIKGIITKKNVSFFIVLVAIIILAFFSWQNISPIFKQKPYPEKSDNWQNLQKIQSFISNVNAQCPFAMEGLGEVVSIIIDGSYVKFIIKVEDDNSKCVINPQTILQQTDDVKNLIKLAISRFDSGKKVMMSKIVESEATVLFEVISDMERFATIGFTNSEIYDCLQFHTSRPEEIRLSAFVNSLNLSLPYDVGFCIIENVKLTESEIIMYCSVNDNNVPINSINIEALKNKDMQSMREGKLFPRWLLSDCYDSNRSIVRRFIGAKSMDTLDVIITPSEIKNNF